MYIQGDLQSVFDALYHMGVIDPVLQMDWTQAMDSYSSHHEKVTKVIEIVNSHQSDLGALMKHLEEFDEQTLSFLAMEVAREFAEFHSRQDLQ